MYCATWVGNDVELDVEILFIFYFLIGGNVA